MTDIPAGHPLLRLFAGVTEQAFITTLGVADPPLVDYVSGLLAKFLHADELARDPAGRLAALAALADAGPGGVLERRERHRHVGDCALFWAGLYPEGLARRPVNVAALGKRAYGIAATFADVSIAVEPPVLLRLGEQFDLCAAGLREVRREFDGLAAGPPRPGAGLIG